MTSGRSEDVAFTFVDTVGNTLRFDDFRYERLHTVGDKHEDNWLSCRITLDATIRHSVRPSLLAWEIKELASAVRAVLEAKEAEFDPMEPWINLKFSRDGSKIVVDATLSITLGIGPDINFAYECRDAEIRATLEEIEHVIAAMPER